MDGRMIIDGQLPERRVIVCHGRPEVHSDLVKRVGPSIEDPRCDSTGTTPVLATAFFANQARDRSANWEARLA